MSPNRRPLRLLNGLASCVALLVVGAIGVILWRAQRASSRPELPPKIQASRNFVAKAHDAVRQGRFAEAEGHYLDALRIRSSQSLSLELAALYGDHHQDAKAVAIYDQVIGKDLSTRDTNALFRYGEACVGMGRPAQARAIFHRIVWGTATDPKDSERSLKQLWSAACVRDSGGNVTVKGGQRALLEKAIRLDPRNWSAYDALIRDVWQATPGQRDRAPALAQLERFRAAVEASGDPKAWVSYAQTLYSNGRPNGALTLLNARYRSAGAADRLVLGDRVVEFQVRHAYDVLNDPRQGAAPAIAYLERCLASADAHEKVAIRSGIGRLQTDHAETLYIRGRRSEAFAYLDGLLQRPGSDFARLKAERDRLERARKTGQDTRGTVGFGSTGPAVVPRELLPESTSQ